MNTVYDSNNSVQIIIVCIVSLTICRSCFHFGNNCFGFWHRFIYHETTDRKNSSFPICPSTDRHLTFSAQITVPVYSFIVSSVKPQQSHQYTCLLYTSYFRQCRKCDQMHLHWRPCRHPYSRYHSRLYPHRSYTCLLYTSPDMIVLILLLFPNYGKPGWLKIRWKLPVMPV